MPKQAPPVCANRRSERILQSDDAGAPSADRPEESREEQDADREEENQKGKDLRGEQGQPIVAQHNVNKYN